MTRGEPNLFPLFAVTAGAGYAIGKGMQVLAPAIGQAIGSAIREGINAKRLREWQKSVEEKLEEVDQLLDELERQSVTELASLRDLQIRATARHFLCNRDRDRALEQDTLYDAYYMLSDLAAELRAVIYQNRQAARAAFDVRIRNEVRGRLEQLA